MRACCGRCRLGAFELPLHAEAHTPSTGRKELAHRLRPELARIALSVRIRGENG